MYAAKEIRHRVYNWRVQLIIRKAGEMIVP
jgi:hypothetical protein